MEAVDTTTTARKATLTIIFRPKVKGGDEDYWYLYIRRPRPAEDEQIPAKAWHLRSDRPAVEAFAAPYRKALRKGLAEPPPETCDEWFERYTKYQKECGHTDPTKATRWSKWISKRIGHKRPEAVTRAEIEDIRDTLDAAIAAWKVQGAGADRISGKTSMNVWSALTSAFKAMTSSKRRDLRVLDGKPNPCTGVEPPGDRHSRKARRKPFVYPKEATLVFACEAIPLEWRELHAIAAYTYLRPGELRVLTWGDIDLDAGLINVTKAWDYNEETIKPPKTRNGVRRVPIEPTLAPLLKRMGKGKQPTDLVVPLLSKNDEVADDNRKVTVDRMAMLFREHLTMADVKRAELHATTATHVQANFRSWRDSGLTWLAMSGLGVDKLSRRAGHDMVQTTMGYVKQAEDLTGDLGTPFAPLPTSLTEHALSGRARFPRLEASTEERRDVLRNGDDAVRSPGDDDLGAVIERPLHRSNLLSVDDDEGSGRVGSELGELIGERIDPRLRSGADERRVLVDHADPALLVEVRCPDRPQEIHRDAVCHALTRGATTAGSGSCETNVKCEAPQPLQSEKGTGFSGLLSVGSGSGSEKLGMTG